MSLSNVMTLDTGRFFAATSSKESETAETDGDSKGNSNKSGIAHERRPGTPAIASESEELRWLGE
eukprot:CAMPEP_0115626722 /NCGR_PEP_ID=MMETSP0272-20121206/28494_1 /TAXON_ID=71861 /ORGANISM="Scrippsiella trochoidea, Strain CCMP3099" /LENGTH=64 /DNA_ID=CAMNT_0003063093 /DNA_START=75 /DNA_END=266 /DNA_ORIENTATION=+